MGLLDKLKNRTTDMVKGYDVVKVNKKLTYEELLEIMQAGKYPCGNPNITGKGMMKCIRFPAVNKYMIQVAINGKRIMITKVYSGAGGALKEVAGNMATDGWYFVFNGENIDLNRMTRIIGDEISNLLLVEDLLRE
jgi:hypothetical protein